MQQAVGQVPALRAICLLGSLKQDDGGIAFELIYS